jgi:hypothetical protein
MLKTYPWEGSRKSLAMTQIDRDWPSQALVSTIDQVYEAALPVLLARTATKDAAQIGMDLSRALIELASDGISDYAQLLNRALAADFPAAEV